MPIFECSNISSGISADVVIIAFPVYWGNITSKMKAFFDSHSGYAMVKPKDAEGFYQLSLVEKRLMQRAFDLGKTLRNMKGCLT